MPVKYSKISDYKIKKITRFFCVDIDATKTSIILGLYSPQLAAIKKNLLFIPRSLCCEVVDFDGLEPKYIYKEGMSILGFNLIWVSIPGYNLRPKIVEQ